MKQWQIRVGFLQSTSFLLSMVFLHAWVAKQQCDILYNKTLWVAVCSIMHLYIEHMERWELRNGFRLCLSFWSTHGNRSLRLKVDNDAQTLYSHRSCCLGSPRIGWARHGSVLIRGQRGGHSGSRGTSPTQRGLLNNVDLLLLLCLSGRLGA